jgi:hypothetical protein
MYKRQWQWRYNGSNVAAAWRKQLASWDGCSTLVAPLPVNVETEETLLR